MDTLPGAQALADEPVKQPQSPARWTSIVMVGGVVLLTVGLFASLISGETAGGKAPGPGEQVRGNMAGAAAIQSTPEQLYVPVNPCRIVDTRLSGGKFNSLTTRSFYVTGTEGFPAQGGKVGGCAIPTNAEAITATFTAVSPSNRGYMRAWAAGGSEPLATIFNYSTFNMGTGVTVPIRPGGTPALTVKHYYGPTHLVIDVTGYYVPQLHASIDASGNITYQSGRLVSATRTGQGLYVLTWDRDVSNCSVQATLESVPYQVAVGTSSSAPEQTAIRVWRREDLAIDWAFHVTVNC